MRATWFGARSGRISTVTGPLVVSMTSVSSGCAMGRVLLRGGLFHDSRRLDVIELGKRLFEVSVAKALHDALVRTMAFGRALAIAGIERIHHVHARDHFAERGKALAVERCVIAEIDEHLRGACIRTCGGEGDAPEYDTLRYRIMGDVRTLPHLRNLGIPVDAELHHEVTNHTEEACVVIEAVLDEIVEAVGAIRRPVAMHFDHEAAFARVELHFVNVGRLLVEACRI